jgi:hypothetical protein
MLAILTWRQPAAIEQVQEPALSPPAPIARLAVATGPVEVQPPRELNWFACPESTELAPGAALRTDATARCEIATQDGSQVRLNGDTQVQLAGARQVSLDRGQLWSHVAEGASPFAVTLPEGKVTAQQGKFALRCEPGQSMVTVVEGAAHVQSGQEKADLSAGQSVTIDQGALSEVRRAHDTALATAWVNELLAAKGSDDPEFVARMDDILAQLGQTKMSFLYEEEIRRLGDHCVLPLVRFLESSRSQGDSAQRVRAAAIVADVAQPRQIPLLIELLMDEDPQVRFHVARGLERLTARDQGRPPAAWRTEPLTSCAPTQKAWLEWWEANRSRYPGAVEPKRSLLKKG